MAAAWVEVTWAVLVVESCLWGAWDCLTCLLYRLDLAETYLGGELRYLARLQVFGEPRNTPRVMQDVLSMNYPPCCVCVRVCVCDCVLRAIYGAILSKQWPPLLYETDNIHN